MNSFDGPADRAWEYQRPPVLVPAPASSARSNLAGRRVIAHDPSDGVWRYDLRAATESLAHQGQVVVGVLAEADWYRQQRDSAVHVAPHSVPLDTLWIEHLVDDADLMPHTPDQSDIPQAAGRARRLVEDITAPPVRYLRPAVHADALVGARACVMSPSGPLWDQRIVGDPRRQVFPPSTLNFTRGVESLGDPVVGTVVPVCREADYYAWGETGDLPRAIMHATRFVWLE